jgi:glycosyltransferase involved in cell wall biosynthesis
MVVGLVTTSYPRWPGDPAGGFVAGHAAYLRSTGATVEIVAADDPAVDRAWDRAQGVTRVAAPPGLFFAGGAPEAIAGGAHAAAARFAARLALAVAARARRWDAVAAHWLAPSALAALPSRGPLLAIGHGGDVHLLARARLLAPTLALLAARRARLAFVAAPLASVAARAFAPAADALLQPMGVDDAAAAAIAQARADRAPTGTVAILARLVSIKGVDVAIAALTRAPSVRLIVGGDGPAREALAAQAHALGVADRVELRGWLDAGARDRLLAEVDAVCLPSRPLPDGRAEGTPLAALEALAAGVPVVASATGGLADLARLGVHLVPPDAPDALAAALFRASATRPAPRPELGWAVVGRRFDEHWGRVA